MLPEQGEGIYRTQTHTAGSACNALGLLGARSKVTTHIIPKITDPFCIVARQLKSQLGYLEHLILLTGGS
jgi:hypothetical protein